MALDIKEALKAAKARDFPRRNCIDLLHPAEKALYDAAQAIAGVGADETLIRALDLVWNAKDLVSDFLERE